MPPAAVAAGDTVRVRPALARVLAEGRLVACGAPGRVLTAELLSDDYERPIEIIEHPRTGVALVLP